MANGVLIINGDWLNSNRIVKKEQGLIDWYDDFTKPAPGTSLTLEVVEKLACITSEIFPDKTFKSIQEGASTAIKSADLIRLSSKTKDAVRTISEIDEETWFFRKATTVMKVILGTLDLWSSVLFFITGFAPLEYVKNGAYLTAEVTDLSESIDDYTQASDLSNIAMGAIKEAVDHSKSYYFYKTLKNIAAIANCALGFIVLAFGLHLLPAVGLACLSFGVTLLTIQRDFFKEAGDYSLIDFKRPVAIR